jgi:PliI/PliC-like inhibitor of I-type lysozyme
MMRRTWLVLALGLGASIVSAADDSRFATKLALPNGQFAVVAEGDFEARSIGSYSVRLYAVGVPDQTDTASFVTGLFEKRDGAIELVRLADIDRDGHDEIIVVMRSAGTGGYLTVHAITLREKHLEMRATVVGLPKDADPVAALLAVTAKEADPNRGPSKRP